MITQFEKLTVEEREQLLKAPILVSMLAFSSFNEVKEIQKADAIKLAHLKTFTATPLLIPYYIEVEKKFKELFEAAIKQYFPFDEAKRIALKKEMDRVSLVIERLNNEYGRLSNKISFESEKKRYQLSKKRIAENIFLKKPNEMNAEDKN